MRHVTDPRPFVAVVDGWTGDALVDDDFHLALYVLYELHYRGFEGVDETSEWDTELLAFRARLEERFLSAVTSDVGQIPAVAPHAIERRLRAEIEAFDGPSLSGYMEREGTIDQFREFAIHRSAYQLKEADPHTWGIPRVTGDAKAALVEIQTDEYGNGDLAAMHSERFAATMRGLGLDSSYGAYVDLLPGLTLATVNLVSLFGLHRRWRGALVGHLAVFEMCSIVPMGRYAAALRRFGFDGDVPSFYDVHVAADAVHEIIASTRLAAGFARSEPQRAADVLFGARALMATEDRFARHLLASWSAGGSSLRAPAAHLAA